MQRKYYFEDFAPGDVWNIEGPLVTKEEIVDFERVAPEAGGGTPR